MFKLSFPPGLGASRDSGSRFRIALVVLLGAVGFSGAWVVGGHASIRAATTLPNPDPPPATTRQAPPQPPAPPPPPAQTYVAPPPPPPTYVAPPPPPPAPTHTQSPRRPNPRVRPRPQPRPQLQPVADVQRRLRPPQTRALAAYLPVPAPSDEPSRALPLALLVLVLLVPAIALALGLAPTRRLPERAEALIEERRETLLALGLMGGVGAAIGIGIVLVGL